MSCAPKNDGESKLFLLIYFCAFKKNLLKDFFSAAFDVLARLLRSSSLNVTLYKNFCRLSRLYGTSDKILRGMSYLLHILGS